MEASHTRIWCRIRGALRKKRFGLGCYDQTRADCRERAGFGYPDPAWSAGFEALRGMDRVVILPEGEQAG